MRLYLDFKNSWVDVFMGPGPLMEEGEGEDLQVIIGKSSLFKVHCLGSYLKHMT